MSDPRPRRQPDGTWALVDETGSPVSSARFRAASALSEGYAVVHRFDGTAALVDATGQELPTHGRRYRWILPMVGGEAPACTLEGEIGHLGPDGRFSLDALGPEQQARAELTRISHLLYERGYNVSIDGNVSWRLDDGNLLITPTGAHLGFIRPEDFVVVDPEGARVRGDRPRPPSGGCTPRCTADARTVAPWCTRTRPTPSRPPWRAWICIRAG